MKFSMRRLRRVLFGMFVGTVLVYLILYTLVGIE